MAAFGHMARPAWLAAPPVQHTSTASLLSPFFRHFQQCRQASILSSLSDNPGAYNKRIRRGRGPASGKGKQAGRGAKGQKKRGKVAPGFEGGQTPLSVVHGTHGFVNVHAQEMTPLNISRVQRWISDGRLDPSKPISIYELHRSGCLTGFKDGVKLLAREGPEDRLDTPIQIIVSRASAAAIAAVERAGGQVVSRYYSPSSLARVMRREAHPYYSLQSKGLGPLSAFAASGVTASSDAVVTADDTQLEAEKATAMQQYKYRLADATGRKDIEYYRDTAHRGYLSHLVPDGHGPNLFFKGHGGVAGETKKRTQRKGPAKAENLLW